MTTEEVTAIFSLLDINKDGKLNYAEVSFYKHQVTSVLTDPVATLLYIHKTCQVVCVQVCEKCVLNAFVSSFSFSY